MTFEDGPNLNDKPLYAGPSKRQWAKALGCNLALLLAIYAIAAVLTACGIDFFMLRYDNPSLDRFEQVLRSWGIYPLVQILFYSIETFIASVYITKKNLIFGFASSHTPPTWPPTSL